MKEILKKHREAATKLGYSREHADEIIHRLSDIMNAFIDAAWGVHPAQLSAEAGDKKDLLPKAQCGKLRTKPKQSSKEETAATPTEG